LTCLVPALAAAQFKDDDEDQKASAAKDQRRPARGAKDRRKAARGDEEQRYGPQMAEPVTSYWQMGMIVTAPDQPCQEIAGTATVPVNWPEQKVRVVEEEVSPAARISYQNQPGSVRQMVVHIPVLPRGQQAKALIKVEIRRSAMQPPADTSVYQIPDLKRLPRDVRGYLAPSPLIESRHQKFKELARRIMAEAGAASAGSEEGAKSKGEGGASAAAGERAEGEDSPARSATAAHRSDWSKVEALYRWVRAKVQFKQGALKGAVAAVRDGSGNHEDLANVFIALCRAVDIPARTVWIPKHCYPEFYLLDDEGQGHWFPCQVAGKAEFGGISETGPILAKGDNFRSPLKRGEHQRFPAETLTGTGGAPRRQFVRELVSP
jgi:hypothetical protein